MISARGDARVSPAGATRTSVRFRLGLAIAIALSPILALGALQAVVAFRHDSDTRRIELTQAALRSAVGARARMNAAATLLNNISPATVGFECAPRLAQLLDHTQGFQNFIRFDADGRLQCAAASVRAGPPIRDRPWFARLRAGEPATAASAQPGRYGVGPALLTAARFEDAQGDFAGALVAVISVDSLRPDVSDPTLPGGAEAALLDPAGRLVAATDSAAFASLPKDWQLKARSPGGLYYHARAPDGADRIHAVAPLVGDDLFITLSTPAEGFWSWTRLNALSGVALPLLAWIAAWAAVWVVADRVVIRWLNYLGRIAAIYAKGRFTVRPVQAADAPSEIRDLAITLDAMAQAIIVRDTSLRESLAQKDTMMREIHHRVKNNLQVITSLLNMQQRALTDPAAREAMIDTRQRIGALALIYRALYQSADLRRVDVREFLEALVVQLSSGEGGRAQDIQTELAADDMEVDPDKLAPLALFAVEAITNARKHAFSEAGGRIKINFTVQSEFAILEVSDNGRGYPPEDPTPGVGRTLMSAFARQLRGDMSIMAVDGGGASVRLAFPLPELLQDRTAADAKS